MSTLKQAAMKQALEALEQYHSYMEPLTTVFGGPRVPAEQSTTSKVEKAINALRQALANEALDRMAENARELGLDYEPAGGTQVSKVWWDGEKMMAKPIPLSEVYKEPEQQPADEPVAWQGVHDTTDLYWRKPVQGDVRPLYTRPQPVAPEFYHHVVENEGDWSEWVNPDNDSYMMKCCDCGLVHEMQFKVAKYSEGDECEFVDDQDLQPMFRARRAEEAWQEKDTAHRAGGLPQPKAEQEPKREPLSTEEAEALWPFDHFRSEAVRLVRKTEAKHGITKDLA